VRSFGGPRDGMPRVMSRQYYKSCYIQGDIDFIFGSATVVFEDCEVYSNCLKSGENSFVTAPSTPEGERYGYVFLNCRLTGDAASKNVYLGRPWRNFGKAAFIDCWLGAHIKEEGWHNWNKPESEQTTEFAEYGSTGPGSEEGLMQSLAGLHLSIVQKEAMDKRVTWSKRLTSEEAKEYSIERVLSGKDGWKPETR
jgi:pectinesterase